MKKLADKLRCNAGESHYVSSLVGLFVALLFLAVILAITPIINQKQRLNSYVDAYARYIEVSGTTDIPASTIAQLSETYQITPTSPPVISTTYIGSTKHIQLETPFTITVEYEGEISVAGITLVPIKYPITAKAVGRSEMYWK